MSIQIKITNGDGILLKCWTNVVRKQKKGEMNQPYFVEKHLSIRIENNHLFICDNSWNSLQIKSKEYYKDPKIKICSQEEEESMIKAKPVEFDAIAIDLTANKECKSITRERAKQLKKTKKKKKKEA